MANLFHEEILDQIKKNSGQPTQHTFLNSYLGTEHPRYPIATPLLRSIAREWMQSHRDLSANRLRDVLSSLIKGPSFTEKVMAGLLLGYSAREQRTFDPAIFEKWLNFLDGWAEVDAVCTNNFSVTQIPSDWQRWKKVIIYLSEDPNINKRRASLVLFCSPLRKMRDERLSKEALRRVSKLQHEKPVLITKAVSWVLRSMAIHHREEVVAYLEKNAETLPRIAVRETKMKLASGRKTKRR